MRLGIFVLLISLVFSSGILARPYSAPVLSEAEDMLTTAPDKALKMTQSFLDQRRLSLNPKRPHATNETDRTIRTPLNSTYAYLIIARAYSLLGNPGEAWKAFEQARQMSEKNNLVSTQVDLIYTEALLKFQLANNHSEALLLLDKLQQRLPARGTRSVVQSDLAFEAALLKANILSEKEQEDVILAQFDAAKQELGNDPNLQLKVRLQIQLGQYFLSQQQYEKALSELLSAFWIASENEFVADIATTNINLAELYKQRGALHKALLHANQAAEFYEHFKLMRGLSRAQRLLASIYEGQRRYNFALVHYFNALDIERDLGRLSQQAAIKVAIASTYLELLHYPLAEQYVSDAIAAAIAANEPSRLAQAYILQGELSMELQKVDEAIKVLNQAVNIVEKGSDRKLLARALKKLSFGYEVKGDYYQALLIQRRFDQLAERDRDRQQLQEAKSFKQRERVIERQLQFEDIERRQEESEHSLLEQKKVNYFLFASLCVLLVLLVLRHRSANYRREQLSELRKDYYTHPHSGLRNLRMLNERLPSSLEKSNAHFEQWYLGEMIHEPLSDRLRFAMFEVPFLKTIHLKYGYQEGIKLERQLGDFLRTKVVEPSRIYHFSDNMFVLIEPQAYSNQEPSLLADKVQGLIESFLEQLGNPGIDSRITIGMAEYPFVPRAYTTINDQDLLDILLMATSASHQLGIDDTESQWVHLSAIESAPAASFVNTDIRKACLECISSGLVKVRTSSTDSINWQMVHGSEKIYH
ncbi:GGDEF domain-containing protein [Veronia nyctiphanis]|uniref:GGDEF domain-containing protein n=1 Tax=Veronia nyctiphanis TaxID=1278244 RepID=A0A4Q0YU33_9GAMM|nr:GGDEF domain-containing protein [Veronia nyctiphanis]RXJ72521.1 GGDEF domain-containing protein [Veronia nyctiphanis]